MNTIFSPLEHEILTTLGRRRMTIAELTEKVSPEGGPFAAGSITSAIRRINLKCEWHELDWYLKGEGLGRGGRTIWREKVQPTKGRGTHEQSTAR